MQPHWGFCFGACQPPKLQTETVLARREFQGRRHLAPDFPPILLEPIAGGIAGGWQAKTAVETPQPDPDWHTLERIVLPRIWFHGTHPWQLLMARRWRAPMHINAGEMLAGLVWVKAFCATVGPKRWQVLILTDPMVTNGVSPTRKSAAGRDGRASPACILLQPGSIR